MKSILLSLVALALLGKAQDETIGSTTTPAKLVANQIKARKTESSENSFSKPSYISPSIDLNNPRLMWSTENLNQLSFLKGDMAIDEKLISVKEWSDNKSNYLLTLSSNKLALYLRLYEHNHILKQYKMTNLFKDDLECLTSELSPVKITVSDYNNDTYTETWIQYQCDNKQKNYLIDKGNFYVFDAPHSIKKLPEYLQSYAVILIK